MSEARWLEDSARPQGLMWQLKGTSATRTKVGRRKLRLFACGCCRAIWQHVRDPQLRGVVGVAERFADGGATARELDAARGMRGQRTRSFSEDHPDAQADTVFALVIATTEPKPFSAAFDVTAFPLPLAGYCGAPVEAQTLICRLLRDVFGNPFRPAAFDPGWRTDTAVSLAAGMYEARDFGAMPILADALQDAGCEHEDVLTHCRDPQQVHVRGCWVVDLVLGKG